MSSPYPRPRSRHFQTRVTTGKELLPGIDGRSKWARRLHDIISNHVADLGGPEAITQAQYFLVKAAANIVIVMEQWEVQFAEPGHVVEPAHLMAYQTFANSIRRIYESLGIGPQEGARNITPPDFSRLSNDERARLRVLNFKRSEVGIEGMPIDQVSEMYRLLCKAEGRGNGPSKTDITPRDRPYDEIDWDQKL